MTSVRRDCTTDGDSRATDGDNQADGGSQGRGRRRDQAGMSDRARLLTMVAELQGMVATGAFDDLREVGRVSRSVNALQRVADSLPADPSPSADSPALVRVTVVGPNLPRALSDRGTFHAHAEGCGDLSRRPLSECDRGWTFGAASTLDVVGEIYSDQIAESDESVEDYAYDVHFAPCLDSLPYGDDESGGGGTGGPTTDPPSTAPPSPVEEEGMRRAELQADQDALVRADAEYVARATSVGADYCASDLWEAAYSDALRYVAMGDERDQVFGGLLDSYPDLEADSIREAMGQAYLDALTQGVEREDIDGSWHDTY